ncbi:hypothetical protein IID21_01350 [Patescibacteria group bacterium]|nr:hypothetical protein [Patescibacteria group bacterium]
MIETPHVIVGAAIATAVANPALALPLALGSHFVLDKIPHWNPHLLTETKKYGKPTGKSTLIVAADVSASLVVSLSIASLALPDNIKALTILAACFLAILPDVVEGPYFFLNIRPKFIEKWINFQRAFQINTSFVPGVLTQVVTVAVSLWWILT